MLWTFLPAIGFGLLGLVLARHLAPAEPPAPAPSQDDLFADLLIALDRAED